MTMPVVSIMEGVSAGGEPLPAERRGGELGVFSSESEGRGGSCPGRGVLAVADEDTESAAQKVGGGGGSREAYQWHNEKERAEGHKQVGLRCSPAFLPPPPLAEEGDLLLPPRPRSRPRLPPGGGGEEEEEAAATLPLGLDCPRERSWGGELETRMERGDIERPREELLPPCRVRDTQTSPCGVESAARHQGHRTQVHSRGQQGSRATGTERRKREGEQA